MSSASTARRGRCASRSATGIVRLRPDADANRHQPILISLFKLPLHTRKKNCHGPVD
jgi:hypothetical protein